MSVDVIQWLVVVVSSRLFLSAPTLLCTQVMECLVATKLVGDGANQISAGLGMERLLEIRANCGYGYGNSNGFSVLLWSAPI